MSAIQRNKFPERSLVNYGCTDSRCGIPVCTSLLLMLLVVWWCWVTWVRRQVTWLNKYSSSTNFCWFNFALIPSYIIISHLHITASLIPPAPRDKTAQIIPFPIVLFPNFSPDPHKPSFGTQDVTVDELFTQAHPPTTTTSALWLQGKGSSTASANEPHCHPWCFQGNRALHLINLCPN